MITTCKVYIKEGVTRVWELSPEELARRISDCVRLNETYQQYFHKTKGKLEETPSERQFDFRYYSVTYSILWCYYGDAHVTLIWYWCDSMR